jgi:hypothetical protein
LRALFDSFGEITQEWTIDDVIAEGDKVGARDQPLCPGQLLRHPRGRLRAGLHGYLQLRDPDGLVVRTWRNAADLQRLLQLGARLLSPTTTS